MTGSHILHVPGRSRFVASLAHRLEQDGGHGGREVEATRGTLRPSGCAGSGRDVASSSLVRQPLGLAAEHQVVAGRGIPRPSSDPVDAFLVSRKNRALRSSCLGRRLEFIENESHRAVDRRASSSRARRGAPACRRSRNPRGLTRWSREPVARQSRPTLPVLGGISGLDEDDVEHRMVNMKDGPPEVASFVESGRAATLRCRPPKNLYCRCRLPRSPRRYRH